MNQKSEEYLKKAEQMCGKELEINKVPEGVWIYKDVVEEAEELFGKNNTIVINS